MEAAATAGGGGGGPAPFLLKTYDMVDDTSTDEIVSWSPAKNSFVVWNPPEFARLLLPSYFKHNNFSSFIRQLNTYGFRKIDPERWEFANEDFLRDQKHLLKNIHRRKPIHSHSHPQGSVVDPERAAFEEKLEKLAHEKAALEARILGFEKQRATTKFQLEDLTQKLDNIEQRQESLLSFFEKAVQDPSFVKRLAQKIEALDFSAYNKKRRLPQVVENSFVDNHSSSRPELGNIIHQDFSNKLRLELSPAVSDINLISHSTQSSNEDGGSPQGKISEGDPKDAQPRILSLPFAPETLELSDTGISYAFKSESYFSRKVPSNGSAGMHSLHSPISRDLTLDDEVDGHLSCHLNLTLASTPLQVNKGSYSAGMPQSGHEIAKSPELRFDGNDRETATSDIPEDRNQGNRDSNLSSLHEDANNNQGPATAVAPVRVNDVFWEQFLTEKPDCCHNEKASSSYRPHPYDEHEDRRTSHGLPGNPKNMEHLSL
uniref:Heat Stress Transcription Factor family protein n=1 Tax=Rhizophora mucronata TaxID=61149 RepID=A0A2P2MZI7_RHIMU